MRGVGGAEGVCVGMGVEGVGGKVGEPVDLMVVKGLCRNNWKYVLHL